MQTTVTKVVDFHAAHRLTDHKGLCYNIHGHTYKLEVTVTSKELQDGMIVDFYELKNLLNLYVVSKFDHAVIINQKSDCGIDQDFEEMIYKHGMKYVNIDDRTTSENIAIYIYKILTEVFEVGEYPFELVNVRLYETDTSWTDVKSC